MISRWGKPVTLLFVIVYPVLAMLIAGTGAGKWIDNFGIQILIYVMLGFGLGRVVIQRVAFAEGNPWLVRILTISLVLHLLAAPSLPGQIREDGSLPLLLGLRAVALWRARGVAASQGHG